MTEQKDEQQTEIVKEIHTKKKAQKRIVKTTEKKRSERALLKRRDSDGL